MGKQMTFRYETAVPWGRNLEEYRRMFSLTDADFARRILGCADGPASFNAEMSKRGRRVVSCDPLYQFTADQIRARIDATYLTVIEQTRANQDRFVWDQIKSPEELGRIRMAAMTEFLVDYSQGAQDGRYITAELPNLPFSNQSFDLALCSHFLFLYSDNFSLEFHQRAVSELLRVAPEVRIFPILNYNAEQSPYLIPIVDSLLAVESTVSIETVPYEFQRRGDKMLKIC
jgi:hypothetical protein